jgi:hypothetical protein
MKYAIATALLLAGCGAFKKPETFPEQAKQALASPKRIGHVDASLQPVAGHEKSWSTRTDSALEYYSNADGKICLRMTTGEQYFRSHGSLDAELGEYSDLASKTSIVFGAYDSLDHASAWPDRSGGVTGSLVDHKLSKHWHSEAHLEEDATEWLDVTLEWCGAAPAVETSTRYVTGIAFQPEGPPTLFVWAIDGTPIGSTSAPAETNGDPSVTPTE